MTVYLTPTEIKVADCVAIGMDYESIALRLSMAESTARVHVCHIADKLPNPDHLKPYTLVLLWAAHRLWIRGHPTSSAA